MIFKFWLSIILRNVHLNICHNTQWIPQIIIDDLSIEDSKPLPAYIPLDLPESIPCETFPKIALVSDAIHFFRHIFTQPEDEIQYTSGNIYHVVYSLV